MLLLVLLVLIAAGIGYWLGKRARRKSDQIL